MGRDNEIAQDIEKSIDNKGQVSLRVVDELLTKSDVFNDNAFAKQLTQTLADRGILPAIVLEGSEDLLKNLKGANDQVERSKLEEAASTGKVGDHAFSATSQFVARALVDRWNQIDTDGVPGISPNELHDWARNMGRQEPSTMRILPDGGKESGPSFDDWINKMSPELRNLTDWRQIWNRLQDGDPRQGAGEERDLLVSPTGSGSDLKFAVMPNNTEAIDSPGIVRDITDGASYKDWSAAGWKLIAKGHAGNMVYESRDGKHVAKIGNVDDITAQAQALEQLRNQFGITTPNFELRKDMRDGKEVGVLIMDKMDFGMARWADPEVLRQAQPLLDAMKKDLYNAGFNVDMTEENWGFKPGVKDKVKEGVPLSPDDIVVIDPVTSRILRPQPVQREEQHPVQREEQQRPAQSFEDFFKGIGDNIKNLTDWHKVWQMVNGEIQPLPISTDKVRINIRRGEEQSGEQPPAAIELGRPRARGFENGTIDIPPLPNTSEVRLRLPEGWVSPGLPVPPTTDKGDRPPPIVKNGVRIYPSKAGQVDADATILPEKPEQFNAPRVRFPVRQDDAEATILPVKADYPNQDRDDDLRLDDPPPEREADGRRDAPDKIQRSPEYEKVWATVISLIDDPPTMLDRGWWDNSRNLYQPPKEFEGLSPREKYNILDRAKKAAWEHMDSSRIPQWLAGLNPMEDPAIEEYRRSGDLL